MTDGVLVLVATPIGNLCDLSPHAVEELTRADVIACEDTRRTGRLLQHAGVSARAMAMVNDHNESSQVPMILTRLGRGERVALVTDAGMPGISDPGERMVRAVVEAGHRIEVVPGPSAFVAAVVVSGFPAQRFVFEGFVPRKGRARTDRLTQIAAEHRTVVFYEAPHRLGRTLTDLAGLAGGDRRVVLARELTKLHEELWRGTLNQAIHHVDAVAPRGEYVVVLGPVQPDAEPDDDALLVALDELMGQGSSVRDASAAVAERFGVSKRRVYGLATGR